MSGPVSRGRGLAGLALAAWTAAAAQQAPPQTVEIIGTSPLPGLGVERDRLPYSHQIVRRDALDAAQADHAGDYLARRLPSVQVNDIQGSPFQADLSFRGYRASGLLGAAQGLSVYLDGVRINEAFGDVVNWDLVPEFALQSLSLLPGANPAFGLNTLGGALALTTASGTSAPGLRAEVTQGSFGRQRLDLAQGGQHDGGWDHFIGVGLFDETGWRDHSDGRLGTALLKLGRATARDDFSLSLLLGQSRLVGNGLVPLVGLDENGERSPDIGQARRAAVYTHPDLTRNRLRQLSTHWTRQVDDDTRLEALAYLRHARRTTINGDEADDESSPSNAALNRSATVQRSAGLSLALSRRHGAHQWQVGAALDSARVSYEQTEQDGVFDDSRGVLPLDESPELSAKVQGRSSAYAAYATDTWQLATGTFVTGTLRLNQARVGNTLGSVDDASGAFENHPRETFTYRSANPSLGIARQSGAAMTLFASIARNHRVPTVIELGCADPEQPCRLPVGLQADPYLDPVRATSVEAGLRWRPTRGPRGSLTLFRTDNRDDILFRSLSVNGQLGYFENFARTRNQGLEAEIAARLGPLDFGLGYSHLNATYQADGVLRMGERNVVVGAGTRIAGLPRHLFKASVDWLPWPGLTVGADLQAYSRRGVAGNEDGRLEDGGDSGIDLSLPGYGIVNLRAAWQPDAARGLELFARVTNAGNRRHASFGALAETRFDATGVYTGEDRLALFVAPGAPRAFTLGLRWKFD